jgi:hypothetical protein
MKVTAIVGLMLLACGLSACGYQARSRMEQSEDAYQQCLLLYPTERSRCDELKKVYEQDKAAYKKS